MADVTISQEQYDEWEALAQKSREIEAGKTAKRRATAIVVKAHEAEYNTVYAQVLKDLLA